MWVSLYYQGLPTPVVGVFCSFTPFSTAVSIAAGSYNAFASEVEHHFYRARVVNTTTGAGHASAFTIHWNFVNDRGSAAN